MSDTDNRLTLLASDADDLPVLSALLQDAIVQAGDIDWDRRRRRLVLLASRFRWEAGETSRVRTALRIQTIQKVERQRWPADPETPLVLLSITARGTQIELAFADQIGLRVTIECLDVLLEDMSAPWDVRHRPHHE